MNTFHEVYTNADVTTLPKKKTEPVKAGTPPGDISLCVLQGGEKTRPPLEHEIRFYQRAVAAMLCMRNKNQTFAVSCCFIG
jgi:hypothetical protein